MSLRARVRMLPMRNHALCRSCARHGSYKNYRFCSAVDEYWLGKRGGWGGCGNGVHQQPCARAGPCVRGHHLSNGQQHPVCGNAELQHAHLWCHLCVIVCHRTVVVQCGGVPKRAVPPIPRSPLATSWCMLRSGTAGFRHTIAQHCYVEAQERPILSSWQRHGCSYHRFGV